ncbi:hypothetical protein SKAU_G00328810 [Synaphobranchus kaupii]|uniref:HAT C-terminal dimerisation domain-containing protein n=1 Tax=Synaphobranchus kaupii TaxID=118154 RepID=A0A9Q1EQ44_SYNKA|nr:hypothetical protein SKAU_G00328810 [Synaphobranchus kaupii]
MDCRPINIVEDQGLQEIIQIASCDPFYKAPSRGTVVARINELYDNEKAMKMELLAQAPFIALTGDHWTSVNNQNYLGVTGHLIDNKWQLHSFALGVVKTEERHFADACARQFIQVSDEWKITDKVTTIGTDSARNMIAAARILPFDYLPCIAHMIQRLITVSLSNSGFDGALAKCRKIVGHFKHSPANAAELKAQQASHGQDEEPLIQDVPTRWNSTLAMITRILQNKEPLKETLAQQKHNLALLTAAEYDRLARLETLLEPCKYVTNLLGGDKYVSCSAVLPALCHLQRKMEVTDDDPAYVLRFKTTFSEDLNKRKENLNITWLKASESGHGNEIPLMEDGDASDEVVGNSNTLLADGIRDQIPVASSVRGEECEQSVVAENSQEGGKAGTSGVEGNSWTEVDGRRRRKRRGQGESGVSQTQGKRHAGVQRGLFGGQQVGSTPTVESEGEWEEKEMGLGDSGEADLSASQVATALDPRFKDLKCMPRAEREEVWRVLCEVLKNREPPRAEVEPEPPKKKMALLLMATNSESDDEAQSNKPLDRYRAEPSIDTEQCPLQWWSTHTGAHGGLAPIAQRYLATPASTVPCERLFSLAGHIVHKKRSSLSSENVNKLVCLSNWLSDK